METFLWVEKYRPKTVEDCVLPKDIKQTFKEFVNNKHIPNLILSGSAGTGKTTVAKAMVEEIGSTWMLINGSEESGIDVLRTKIKNFASTVSLEGGRKYIILDEADYLNPQSTQPALRGFMEEFHKNCGFILTCNYKNRLIEPLQSRCSNIEFAIKNGQRENLASPVAVEDYDDFRAGTRKPKLRKDKVWVVEIRMPKELIQDVNEGYMELEGREIDQTDLDDAYEQNLSDVTSNNNVPEGDEDEQET